MCQVLRDIRFSAQKQCNFRASRTGGQSECRWDSGNIRSNYVFWALFLACGTKVDHGNTLRLQELLQLPAAFQ